MKNLFYTLFFLSFAYISNAMADSAITARCKIAAVKPKVTVKAVFEPLRYDFTKVSRTLARLHQQQSSKTLHEGYTINGLTPYHLKTNLSFTIGKKVLNDGVTCFFPLDVELELIFKEPTIYIARSVKKGTCEYEVTLRHEQTHEQINVEALEYYLPKISDRFVEAVKKYAVAGRPKDDVSMEAVQESLQQRYLKVIEPLTEELNNEIVHEQEKMDRLEQYNYESGLCF